MYAALGRLLGIYMKLNEEQKEEFKKKIQELREKSDPEILEIMCKVANGCQIVFRDVLTPYLKKEERESEAFMHIVVSILAMICSKELYRLHKASAAPISVSLDVFGKKLFETLQYEEIEQDNPELFKDH